jgi:hypothetical protein
MNARPRLRDSFDVGTEDREEDLVLCTLPMRHGPSGVMPVAPRRSVADEEALLSLPRLVAEVSDSRFGSSFRSPEREDIPLGFTSLGFAPRDLSGSGSDEPEADLEPVVAGVPRRGRSSGAAVVLAIGLAFICGAGASFAFQMSAYGLPVMASARTPHALASRHDSLMLAGPNSKIAPTTDVLALKDVKVHRKRRREKKIDLTGHDLLTEGLGEPPPPSPDP